MCVFCFLYTHIFFNTKCVRIDGCGVCSVSRRARSAILSCGCAVATRAAVSLRPQDKHVVITSSRGAGVPCVASALHYFCSLVCTAGAKQRNATANRHNNKKRPTPECLVRCTRAPEGDGTCLCAVLKKECRSSFKIRQSQYAAIIHADLFGDPTATEQYRNGCREIKSCYLRNNISLDHIASPKVGLAFLLFVLPSEMLKWMSIFIFDIKCRKWVDNVQTKEQNIWTKWKEIYQKPDYITWEKTYLKILHSYVLT